MGCVTSSTKSDAAAPPGRGENAASAEPSEGSERVQATTVAPRMLPRVLRDVASDETVEPAAEGFFLKCSVCSESRIVLSSIGPCSFCDRIVCCNEICGSRDWIVSYSRERGLLGCKACFALATEELQPGPSTDEQHKEIAEFCDSYVREMEKRELGGTKATVVGAASAALSKCAAVMPFPFSIVCHGIGQLLGVVRNMNENVKETRLLAERIVILSVNLLKLRNGGRPLELVSDRFGRLIEDSLTLLHDMNPSEERSAFSRAMGQAKRAQDNTLELERLNKRLDSIVGDSNLTFTLGAHTTLAAKVDEIHKSLVSVARPSAQAGAAAPKLPTTTILRQCTEELRDVLGASGNCSSSSSRRELVVVHGDHGSGKSVCVKDAIRLVLAQDHTYYLRGIVDELWTMPMQVLALLEEFRRTRA